MLPLSLRNEIGPLLPTDKPAQFSSLYNFTWSGKLNMYVVYMCSENKMNTLAMKFNWTLIFSETALGCRPSFYFSPVFKSFSCLLKWLGDLAHWPSACRFMPQCTTASVHHTGMCKTSNKTNISWQLRFYACCKCKWAFIWGWYCLNALFVELFFGHLLTLCCFFF